MEPTAWPFTSATAGVTSGDVGANPTLYSVALQWLKEDRERRRALEGEGRKRRGARTEEVSCGRPEGERRMRGTGMRSCRALVLRVLTAPGWMNRYRATRKHSTRSKQRARMFRWLIADAHDGQVRLQPLGGFHIRK